MDGTGVFYADFIAALPTAIETVVVKYPLDRAMTYAELEVLVRASLPVERPFVLLAESFSGPIAVSIAASKPAGLRGLVLVCSFVRNPVRMPNLLSFLLSRFPVRQMRTRIAAALLLGRYASKTLRAHLAAVIAKVSPVIWRARLRQVLAADVVAQLRKIEVPVIYLRAASDRVVSRDASKLICKLLPAVRVFELKAPHFMLQAKPVESAARVEAFVRDVSISF